MTTKTTDPAIADDDLLSDEAIRTPHRYFGRLREHDPVHWNERHHSWVVTRYAEVAAGFREPRLSSDRILPHFSARDGDGEASWLDAVRGILAGWMVFKDPPEHTRLRRAAYRAFTPRTVRLLEPRVRLIIDELLDRLAGPGEVDFVKELAFPLPAIVIAELLGVPPSDRELFKQFSDELKALVFGDLAVPDRHERAGRALLGLAEYFDGLFAHYRSHPADNVISTLLAAQEADGLSEAEVVATCVLLLFAGHETTTNLLANGLLALLEHPDQLARLRVEPALAPPAVEELLRYDGPAKLSVRWASDDLELAGRRVRANQRVLLVHAAANRDPAVFERPDEVVIDRADNPHLAFGLATHYCLGAPLARLEAQLALPRVLERFPDLRLAGGEPEWHRTILIRGPRALPVVLGDAAEPRA